MAVNSFSLKLNTLQTAKHKVAVFLRYNLKNICIEQNLVVILQPQNRSYSSVG